MPRWRVDIIRKKAEHLGIVTAHNAQQALHRAASLFQIEPDQYSKFVITKIEEYEVGVTLIERRCTAWRDGAS